MIVRRFLLGLGACALAAAFAACGGGGSTTSITTIIPGSPAPSPTPAGTTFVALGDDAAVGIGTNVCGTTLPSTPCPSSATIGGTPLTVNGVAVKGYAQTFAQHLSSLHSSQEFFPVIAGVTGSLVGAVPVSSPTPANDELDNASQIGSLPGIASGAAGRTDRLTISFFAGINDVVDAYFSGACALSAGTLTGTGNPTNAAPCSAHGTTLPVSTAAPRSGSLYNAYSAVFTDLKSLKPYALIVVTTPDLSRYPYFSTNAATKLSASQSSTLSSDVQLANAALQAAAADSGLKFALLDLYTAAANQPGFYSPLAFSSDGFHFSEPGYANVEGLMEAALTATYPSF